MSDAVDADRDLHREPCENCGTTFDTMPGHDNYLELTHYTTTSYKSAVFCDSACLDEWSRNGGVLN